MNRMGKRSFGGSITTTGILLLISILAFVVLAVLALRLRPDARRQKDAGAVVRVYCAAGVAAPIEQVIQEYSQQYGQHIELARTGGSGELAGQIETEHRSGLDGGADLFVSADAELLEVGHSQGVIAEQIPLANQRPVIAAGVQSDFQVSDLRQLVQRNDLRLGIASRRAAVGKLTREIADREGYTEQLETRIKTDAENVMTLAQALVGGALDAAVVWDTTVQQINQNHQSPVLRVVSPADPKNETFSHIAMGVVARSNHPTETLRFARYLAAQDGGLPRLAAVGFETVEGDVWEEVPEIHLYCGSMFTPVLEERVRQFAEREGVNIYPRWEGCGKLVAAMRSIRDPSLSPDAYLACDQQFMDQVQPMFEPRVVLSSNDIVIAVRRASRVKIGTPQDLLQDGLRLGLCDPSQSALGYLTKELFSRPPYEGLYKQLVERVSVTVDVGPTLVSQLLAGGLDAAVVYRSNIVADPTSLDQMDLVGIDVRGAQARAIQPWAVSKTTRNRQLLQRLFDVIISDETQADFRESGFEWSFGHP